MKKLLFTLAASFILIACKEDSPKPEPEIRSIVGTWKLAAYERIVNGAKVWVPVEGEPNRMTFRFDGVILDANGLPGCCTPDSYYVNGTLFEVKPKAEVPNNPRCSLVDCVGCESWSIDQSDNELIVTICEPLNSKSKYIRE